MSTFKIGDEAMWCSHKVMVIETREGLLRIERPGYAPFWVNAGELTPLISSTESKSTNPKDAIGSSKINFHLIPSQVMGELALALTEGAAKYGAHNYRVAGVRWSVYHNACLRHLMAYAEGQDIDSDSGLPHIVKAIACLVVLRDSQMQGNHSDDRPPRAADYESWVSEMNGFSKRLLEKFPEPKAPHTQKDLKP